MLTATQLFRQAALATGATEIKPGKIIEYADPPLVPVDDAYCWLCGGETGGVGIPRRVSDVFTDYPYARNHDSQSFCPGCAFYMPVRGFRNYSIMAAERVEHPSRERWRALLLTPPAPPFVMCLAVSGQKHLLFKTPVNYDRTEFTVLLEEQPIIVRPAQLRELLDLTERLYGWFTKAEIETGRYSQYRIQQCGLGRWAELEERLAPHRRTPLLSLALFVAQKPPEEVMESAALPAAEPMRTGADSGPAQLGFDWA